MPKHSDRSALFFIGIAFIVWAGYIYEFPIKSGFAFNASVVNFGLHLMNVFIFYSFIHGLYLHLEGARVANYIKRDQFVFFSALFFLCNPFNFLY